MTLSELLINIVISATTGVAASMFVWWVTISKFIPNIRFAEEIAKVKTNENPSGFRYRFKFENSGLRDIIDLEVIVRLRISSLREALPKNNEIVYLSTSSLDYKRVAILRPAKKGFKRAVLEIKAYDCNYFEKSIFPTSIRTLAQQKKVTLDDIFAINDSVDLQVIIFGYDAFSGVRKYFESKIYKKTDIVLGTYNSGSLKLISTEEQTAAN